MTEDEKRKLQKVYLLRLRKILKTRSEPLIESIKQAFADVHYPKDENLVSTAAHRAICGECERLYSYFVGKTWREILEHETIGWLSQGQSFFLPLAWQYYLPAFLIYLIRDKYFSAEFLQLNFSQNEELIDFQQSRVELLTSWQCDVIIEYLEVADKLWQGINARTEAANVKALNYWKENYRNALAREKNLDE